MINESLQNKVAWDGYDAQQIGAELSKIGYKVSSAALRQPGNTEKAFVEKYGEIPADAVLDFYYDVGHLASGATTNYVPTVNLRARLTELKSNSVVYEEQFTAGLATDNENVNISLSGKEYADIGELVAGAPESIEALKVGIQQIAKRLASDLAK